MKIGANYFNNGRCEFTVWSPSAKAMQLNILNDKKKHPMEKDENDYWRISLDVSPGTKYFFVINEANQKPDPASNYQPDGVHGPSQVVDHTSFKWDDKNWNGIPLKEQIIYELHTGTFTGEGMFKSIIEKLDHLKELGINMIEIMPVAQFPGNRNWGYDGVYPFAVQNSYGSVNDFKEIINECHKNNMGVILDVVYNHLGPEGNYLIQYGPYFTSKYKTVWGDAINFDGEYSDHIRNYFIENALYWLNHFHIDALRLDAVHSIYDMGAKHFLSELKERVDEFSKQDGRERYLIAESDLNDVRIINPVEEGGYNLDAQWSDDFHHAVHSYLTGEKNGYYQDFGNINHIKKALKETFVYSGNYSDFRKRKHGNSAKDKKPTQFVICSQNHDQVGNRAFGERLPQLVEFEKLKLAAGLMILSPYIPLIFMGEEYAEESPFLYFISHSDESLIENIRKGRKAEFSSFNWTKDIPDPQSDETFFKSKLNWELKERGKNKSLFQFYKKLIRLRKTLPSFKNSERNGFDIESTDNDKIIFLKRRDTEEKAYAVFNLNEKDTDIEIRFDEGRWEKILASSSEEFCGPGDISPNEITEETKIKLNKFSFTLYMGE